MTQLNAKETAKNSSDHPMLLEIAVAAVDVEQLVGVGGGQGQGER